MAAISLKELLTQRHRSPDLITTALLVSQSVLYSERAPSFMFFTGQQHSILCCAVLCSFLSKLAHFQCHPANVAGTFGNFKKFKLEGTARYVGLLLAPAEGFGLWPRALWAKKELFTLFVPILGLFWCSVVNP